MLAGMSTAHCAEMWSQQSHEEIYLCELGTPMSEQDQRLPPFSFIIFERVTFFFSLTDVAKTDLCGGYTVPEV